MNPKDSSYLLKDDFYKHVQRDWPAYGDEERQLISRLLARWVRDTSDTRCGCPPLLQPSAIIQTSLSLTWSGSLFLTCSGGCCNCIMKPFLVFFLYWNHCFSQFLAANSSNLIWHIFLSPPPHFSHWQPYTGANRHSETELVSTCYTINLFYFHAQF